LDYPVFTPKNRVLEVVILISFQNLSNYQIIFLENITFLLLENKNLDHKGSEVGVSSVVDSDHFPDINDL